MSDQPSANPFDQLSRDERRRLRAEAPALAEEVARGSRFKAGHLADAPAVRVTDPVALAAIARAYRLLLLDQSEAFSVVRLCVAEALAFPNEQHPREWCTVYACIMLSGMGPPETTPVLGVNVDGDIALVWGYRVCGMPPEKAILSLARERLRTPLERLAATPIEAFVAGSTVRSRARR